MVGTSACPQVLDLDQRADSRDPAREGRPTDDLGRIEQGLELVDSGGEDSLFLLCLQVVVVLVGLAEVPSLSEAIAELFPRSVEPLELGTERSLAVTGQKRPGHGARRRAAARVNAGCSCHGSHLRLEVPRRRWVV